MGEAFLLLWPLAAYPNYRLWYVAGYEAHNLHHHGRANEYNRHYDRHKNGMLSGGLAMLGGPFALAWRLVVNHGTPVPPTRAKEIAEEALALEKANADSYADLLERTAALERELQIGVDRA